MEELTLPLENAKEMDKHLEYERLRRFIINIVNIFKTFIKIVFQTIVTLIKLSSINPYTVIFKL